ncbi:uncharacterized protein PHALS_03381 [Plasmopara halstedii]|uniref:Uncharacterized protein n=1 Tax=Plasmopara halstedii TaxID=4781 RepID=A0A0P1A8T2_PLAHL|nr:uncharacterized protein PHALS_03381 [Plasmopara halstedii]CEG36717.1 hypothetical protein PHALS_03381 [Plasmopara halstedii]|eukprot:XP_024573086.1 hypothetical protein PHALS_03381 [Plasmopara halstedii]
MVVGTRSTAFGAPSYLALSFKQTFGTPSLASTDSRCKELHAFVFSAALLTAEHNIDEVCVFLKVNY